MVSKPKVSIVKADQDRCLVNEDHLWVVNNFQKKPGTTLNDPLVNAIFAHYVPQQQIQFSFNKFGKPSLLPVSHEKISISLSHSRNLLVVFISLNDAVGVDVEYVKNRAFAKAIACRYRFGEKLTFYQSWTAREAFIKAIGSGLFKDMSKIQVQQREGTIVAGIGDYFSHRIDFIEPSLGFTAAVCRQRSDNKSIKIYQLSCETIKAMS